MPEPAEETKQLRMSEAEYLTFEAAADARHEYRNGRVIEREPAEYCNAVITANLASAIGNRLAGRSWHVLGSDMRLGIPLRTAYVYPDASVVCGPPQFPAGDATQTTLLNPAAVVEVVSDSTEADDRGAKFDAYRDIAPMRVYVLVASNRPAITAFTRHDNGLWSIELWKGLDATAVLGVFNARLPLAEVYDGVGFEEEDNAAAPPPDAS